MRVGVLVLVFAAGCKDKPKNAPEPGPADCTSIDDATIAGLARPYLHEPDARIDQQLATQLRNVVLASCRKRSWKADGDVPLAVDSLVTVGW